MAQDEPEPRLALEYEEEPDGAVEASRLPFGERPLPALGGARVGNSETQPSGKVYVIRWAATKFEDPADIRNLVWVQPQ